MQIRDVLIGVGILILGLLVIIFLIRKNRGNDGPPHLFPKRSPSRPVGPRPDPYEPSGAGIPVPRKPPPKAAGEEERVPR